MLDVSANSRRADVQGLRAVSVLLVVAYHAGVAPVSGGYLGVDVFFVISGFVITLALLRQHEATGRIDLFRFAVGRIRRLVPTTLVVVATTLVALLVVAPSSSLGETRIQAFAAVLGIENLRFAAAGVNYLADESPAPFLHFWSLGIEEQFYLAWPLLLLILLKLGGNRRKSLPIISVAVLCALSFALAVILTEAFAPWSFYLPVTRAWELGAGCLLALAGSKGLRGVMRGSGLPGWLAMAALLSSVAVVGASTPHPSWPTLLPVVAVVLILGAPSDRGASVTRFLAQPVLTAVGDRSYSLYLWHWPALVVPVLALGRTLTVPEVLLAVLVALGLSECTFRWVERRHRPDAGPHQRRTMSSSTSRSLLGIGAAASVTLLLAGLVGASPVTATAKPRAPYATVVPELAELGASLPPVYADGCHLERLQVEAGSCLYGPDDANLQVVLLGDSHAAQWFSPLEEAVVRDRGALTSLTKSACPFVDLELRDTTLQRTYDECATWRQQVLRRTIALSPDLIVLSAAGPGYRGSIASGEPFEETWANAYARTIEQLTRDLPETDVVVLGETPRWPAAPVLCVTASVGNSGDCSAPTTSLVDERLAAAEEDAVVDAGALYVPTVPWLCDDRCQPVVDGVFVYRDTSHVTDTVARRVASQLASNLPAIVP